jgi:hypothetical protein
MSNDTLPIIKKNVEHILKNTKNKILNENKQPLSSSDPKTLEAIIIAKDKCIEYLYKEISDLQRENSELLKKCNKGEV